MSRQGINTGVKSAKLRVFVSSVQDELINERTAIVELINSDSFLSDRVEAILFEEQPARSEPPEEAYLADLETCEVYVGIIGFEYGTEGADGLSAMHREYVKAKELGLEILFFIRGQSGQDRKRDARMMSLFDEVRDNKKGHTYRRFSHYRDLKKCVRKALLPIIKKRGFSPTDSQEAEFNGTLEAASGFDTQLLKQAEYSDLDEQLTLEYTRAVLGKQPTDSQEEVRKVLFNRGLIWFDDSRDIYRPTAAGMLMFGKRPDAIFPQCRLVANAYSGNNRTDPIDRRDIRLPLPRAIEAAIQFLIRNTRHITKVRSFSRIAIDEYPYEAMREALINAVAHRDYGFRGSSIRIEKFADRLVIMSPGGPPPPVTIQKLRSLSYTPCSRNPNIARALSYFERIEEQGDGIRRIVNEVRNTGLPNVEFSIVDGYFTVSFVSPGANLSKLRPVQPRVVYEVAPAATDRLNANQKQIIKRLLQKGQVNVSEMVKLLKVTPQAVRKDMASLQNMEIVKKRGKARATYYVLKEEPAQV